MTFFEHIVTTQKPKGIRMMSEGKIGARLCTYKDGTQAIMKIGTAASTKTDRAMQRGIPTEFLPEREVAFYRLSRVIGFDVVPETVLGSFQGFPASFQQYVTSAKLYDVEPRLRKTKDREAWAVVLRTTLRDVVPFADTLHLTVLDFLAASRDRHAANYGTRLDVSSGKTLLASDWMGNGCAFGLTQEMYHCVAHKHLFTYAFDLESVWERLQNVKRSSIVQALSGLISDVCNRP